MYRLSRSPPPPPSLCTIRERLSHVLGFHTVGFPLGLLACQSWVMTGVMSNARSDQAPAGKLLIRGSGLVHFGVIGAENVTQPKQVLKTSPQVTCFSCHPFIDARAGRDTPLGHSALKPRICDLSPGLRFPGPSFTSSFLRYN